MTEEQHDRFTTVIAVDAKTRPQADLTWPTWHRNKPEVTHAPLVVIYDASIFTAEDMQAWATKPGMVQKRTTLVPWPAPGADPAIYANQRERMLTAFVLAAPRAVTTDWWLKLDTDAVALTNEPWLTDQWFEIQMFGPAHGKRLPWIASPWGYTKPGEQMAQLDAWGDQHPRLAKFPPLNIAWKQGERRCRHPRMCSWISFYNTAWSREAADDAELTCGPGKMPVPSQDGYHWYYSKRRGDHGHTVRFNRRGWTNVSKYAALKETVEAVMAKPTSD